MNSIFNETECAALIQRLNKLQPDTRGLWGKMTVSQMLAHCQMSFKIANDEVKMKRGIISYLFGGIARKKLTSSKPFTKGLPTAKEFIIADARIFEQEKNTLIELLKNCSTKGASGLTKDPHPFFGNLNATEWDILLWKHLDHHLRQFGV